MHKNDFAPIPPMGWDSSDYYGTEINEVQIKANAHYMAEHLKEYGWEYIMVDIKFLSDKEKFPSSTFEAGYKPLVDHIHKLGLKFAIHITGEISAATIQEFAFRGVDFIQCDTRIHDTDMLSKGIKEWGRPILLSLSGGPALLEYGWQYANKANMWRITDDILNNIPEKIPCNFMHLKEVFHRCELWQTHVQKGRYPDCGLLPFSKTHKNSDNSCWSCFTTEEIKTLMTLWCLFGSPLMLGGDLTQLSSETLRLLTNNKILAMLHPECVPHQICREDTKAIWQADNAYNEEHYVAFFNLSEKLQTMDVTLRDLGYYTTSAKLTELWTGNLAASRKGKITVKLKPHACIVYHVEF